MHKNVLTDAYGHTLIEFIVVNNDVRMYIIIDCNTYAYVHNIAF